MSFLAAVVQLTSTTDVESSMKSAEALVREANRRGAKLVVLPENTSFMGSDEEKRKVAEPIEGPTFARLSALAKREGIWLVGGTLPEKGPTQELTRNTSVVFSPEGRPVAAYRKIHLFDVALGEGATFKESSSVAPGEHGVVVETPLANVGLSVCYDLRFPALYRALVHAGAELLTVPAAFTVPTGRDHWEVLLRARAIENQCYVLAAGQFGQNTEKRATFGRSMIIDPWGTVLALAPDRPSVAVAEIDLDHLRSLRRRLPCLEHERAEIPVRCERA
jgi:deaminated glutathione amidase